MSEQQNVFVMDYDLTIADEGQNYRIRKSVKDKLKTFKSCKLILATGRKFEDIPDKDVLGIFDAIVSENGTILAMDKGKTRKKLVSSKWLDTKEKLIKIIEKKNEEGKLEKKEYEINATEEQAKLMLKDPRIRESGGSGKAKDEKVTVIDKDGKEKKLDDEESKELNKKGEAAQKE